VARADEGGVAIIAGIACGFVGQNGLQPDVNYVPAKDGALIKDDGKVDVASLKGDRDE